MAAREHEDTLPSSCAPFPCGVSASPQPVRARLVGDGSETLTAANATPRQDCAAIHPHAVLASSVRTTRVCEEWGNSKSSVSFNSQLGCTSLTASTCMVLPSSKRALTNSQPTEVLLVNSWIAMGRNGPSTVLCSGCIHLMPVTTLAESATTFTCISLTVHTTEAKSRCLTKT